jgi:simple sugar transport system substrate-binding protein
MKRLLLLALVLFVAGCGRSTEVREPDIVVEGDAAVPTREAPDQRSRGLRIPTARLVFVTHGQASDSFWNIVKRGITEARRQTGVEVSYRAPDRFSLERMRRFIDQAVADRPDGLVVSLPDATALKPSIEAAVEAGIPVVTINSGSSTFKELRGVLAHVGQPEYRAGLLAGRRLARAGVRRALCVNQEDGNIGLDQRCRGLADALARRGGTAKQLPVPLQNARAAQRALSTALASDDYDGIVTLGPGGATPALAAAQASSQDITLATFDLSPEVLTAVRDGKMLFAVDQQPYLQGYLPVMLLAERARYGVFPGEGELVPTGPLFVTEDNAAEVLELSAEGIR